MPSNDMLVEGQAVLQEVRADSHETWLFHGAHKTCIELIAAKGFDIRVSRHGTLGQGTYFANCSAYSDRYVDALPGSDLPLICPCAADSCVPYDTCSAASCRVINCSACNGRYCAPPLVLTCPCAVYLLAPAWNLDVSPTVQM